MKNKVPTCISVLILFLFVFSTFSNSIGSEHVTLGDQKIDKCQHDDNRKATTDFIGGSLSAFHRSHLLLHNDDDAVSFPQ